MLPLLANVAALKIGWLLAVFGAAQGAGWIGPSWAVCVVTIYCITTVHKRAEFELLILACVLGTMLDSVVLQLGFIEFAEPGPVAGLAPLWIVGLWALLATAMTRSLAWLGGRPWVAGAVGLTLAPLSYWAGAKIGAAEFGVHLTAGLAAYALLWAVALPLLTIAAEWRRSLEPKADRPRPPRKIAAPTSIPGRSVNDRGRQHAASPARGRETTPFPLITRGDTP